MKSNYIKIQNNSSIQTQKASVTHYRKKLILVAAFLVAFFGIFSISTIRAQITSIISEDGDGIIGVTTLMNAVNNNDIDAVKFFVRSEGNKIV